MAENKHLFFTPVFGYSVYPRSCSRNGRPQTETSSHSSSNAELVTVEAGLRIHYSCFELLYLIYLF